MTPASSAVAVTDGFDDEDAGSEAAADAVVFRLGDGRFAVALGEVAEVGKVPHVTRVPGVPGWLAGAANWRGRILPVLDLRTLMGAEAGHVGAAARLVVLTSDVATVGVLVDAVEGTAALGTEDATSPPPVAGLGAGLVCGQVVRDEGPVAVVDVAAVMRLRDALPRSRHKSEEGSWTSPSG